MSVTVSCNGVALNPQPADVIWDTNIIEQKLNGTDGMGAYEKVTLRFPVDRGGTAFWNLSSYENSVLTSIVLPARFDTMRGTGVTYSSGVVSRRIKHIANPVGGLVRDVELEVLVILP